MVRLLRGLTGRYASRVSILIPSRIFKPPIQAASMGLEAVCPSFTIFWAITAGLGLWGNEYQQGIDTGDQYTV